MDTLSCTEALAVVLIEKNLSWDTYRVLAKFLEVDTYIMPEDRRLDIDLVNYVIADRLASSMNLRHELFNAWLILDKIEITLTYKQQWKILSWILHNP